MNIVEKNKKAMMEAIRSGNKLIEAQLREAEGWTEDEIMDLLEDMAELRFEQMSQSGDLMTLAELDEYAGEDDYFDN